MILKRPWCSTWGNWFRAMKLPEWLGTAGTIMTILLTIGACSDTSVGEPTSAETATSQPSPSSSNPNSSVPRDSDKPFQNMDACDVLDEALNDMEENFPDGEPDTIGSDNGCQTNKPQKVSVSLDLQEDNDLKDFGDDPSKLYDGDIKGRSAVEMRDGYEQGSCTLAMRVGAANIALVGVTSSKMTRDEGCELVEDIARKVEPLLPDQPS